MAITDRSDRDAEIIGREGVDDLEAILSVSNTDVDEAIHTVADNADAIFTWDYEKGARPALNKLYEKAKHSQWNGQTDLDWSIDVDQEKFAAMISEMRRAGMAEMGIDLKGTPFETWNDKEWTQLSMASWIHSFSPHDAIGVPE